MLDKSYQLYGSSFKAPKIGVMFMDIGVRNLEKTWITYVMKGRAFENGLSIYELNIGLTEFQHLLESSYLTLTGQQRMTKSDREKLKITSRELRPGSFIGNFELELFETATQLALPFFATLTPSQIWQLTKNTFEFLKLIFSLKKKQKDIEVNVGDNNSGVTVNVLDKQKIVNQYNFYGPVYMCAERSLPSYKSITKLIDNGQIDMVTVQSGKETGIKLTSEDKDLFNLPLSRQEQPVTVKAEIYRFDKYKNTGKIRVYPLQSIPEGDYTFSLDEKNDYEKCIALMAENIVSVKVLAEYSDDAFCGKKVSNLKLIDIA